MWGDHGDWGWWTFFGVFWMSFIWMLIGFLLYSGIRGHLAGRNVERDPLEIARHRYARGEIGLEELREIEANLGARK